MTHPSSSETASVQPLTKDERAAAIAYATAHLRDCQVESSHIGDSTEMDKAVLRYEATIRELESRSPSPAPIDADLIHAAQRALEWAAKYPLGGDHDGVVAGRVYELLHPLVDPVVGRYRSPLPSSGDAPATPEDTIDG